MSMVYDDIMGTGTKKTPAVQPQVGQPKQPPAVTPQPTSLAPTAKGLETPTVAPRLSYVDIFQRTSPYKPPTPEELEKQRKKQKRDAIFAAIGDGISALSNLYFTTKGAPNAYDPTKSLSATYRRRYDRLQAEHDAKNKEYTNGYMRAMQADDATEKTERSWRRQLERDKVADNRYNSEQERNDKRYEDSMALKKEHEQRQAEQWQKVFDANQEQRGQSNALGWANHSLNVQAHKDNKEIRKEQVRAQGARGVRGKRIGFSDGAGNDVGIYENVWRGSMQQVFDAISADLRPSDKTGAGKWDRMLKKLDTPRKKEDFVKQNWNKSKNAASIMLALSKIDPATMSSELSEDEHKPSLGWGKKDNNNETDW